MADTKPRLRKHSFADSGQKDHHGTPICRCGSLKTDALHRWPDVDERVREEEERRTGDRD